MDARNRRADVIKLRGNIVQDFLRMIIIPDWQKKLFSKTENEVNNDGKYKNACIAAYEIMLNKEDTYSIDDMDVTFIWHIICSWQRDLLKMQLEWETKNCFKSIKNDRNITNHSGENESQEEIYLLCLLSLLRLREFVNSVFF